MNANVAWIRVLLVPWQRRRNQGSMWPWALIAGLLTAMTFGPAAFRIIPFSVAGAILLSLFALVCWFAFVVSLMQQNEPHAARLVPGQLRLLRVVWAVGWASTVLLAGVIGAYFGFGLLTGLGAASLTLGISWMARWPWLGTIAWLVSALGSRIGDSPPGQALGRSMVEAWRGAPAATGAAIAGVLVVAAVLSALTILRSGSARHVRNYRFRNAVRAAAKKGGQMQAGQRQARSPSIIGRIVGWPYRAWLKHMSDLRHAPQAPVLSRALLGLGPGLHWSGTISTAISFAAWIGVFGLIAAWLYPSLQRSSLPALFWAMTALLGWVATTAGSASAIIYRTRREQALLLLLPGMPRGEVLNRSLARRMVVQFLLAWAISTAIMIALLGLDHEHLAWFVSFAAACLWPMVRMCTDWSRMPVPGASGALLLMFLPVALALLAVGLETWAGVPPVVCVLGLTSSALAVTAWRYRQVLHAPTAFPAARFRSNV